MKPRLAYFASFFLFQIAAAQGSYRGTVQAHPAGLIAKVYKSETPKAAAKTFIKTNAVPVAQQRAGTPAIFPSVKHSVEDNFPVITAVLSVPFVHVPGFLVGFPIPVARFFNRQKWENSTSQIKINGGIMRRNEAGIIMNF